MKGILSFLGIVMSVLMFSQIPKGKTKSERKLKNTLNSKALKSQKKNLVYSYGEKRVAKRMNNTGRRFGRSSEVFIEILNSDYYTVELNDEIISSPYGKFRFFEVPSGYQTLSIYNDGYLIYRTYVEVERNARTVLEFIEGEGLFLVGILGINGVGGTMPNIMSPVEFTQFKQMLKNSASFDEDRIQMIKGQLSAGRVFNVYQIRQMVSMFSFDNNRLKILIEILPNCIDPQNYYLLENELSFMSNKRKFRKIIE
ncbi:MAG: hypothetical protein CSA38_05130 [Flavobacteriales bacterium]|nr:MAG: hypothetical protein CSA38_05130 [Flavobacteriales bacterium]